MQQRNSAVDFLRGLSIAIVAMSHTVGFMTWNFSPWTSSIPALPTNGYYGVCVFFVISGYLIARRLMTLSDLPPNQFLRAFYVQRIGRIVPCLILVVLLAAILSSLNVPRFTFGAEGFDHFTACIATFRYNHCVLDGSLPDGWNALWSLSVEEMFYLFFPILMLLTRRSKITLTSILAAYVILAPAYRATLDIGNVYTYFGNFDLMATGILVALHGKAVTGYSAHLRVTGLAGLAMIFFSTVATANNMWAPSAIAAFTGLYLLGATTARTAPLQPLKLAGILSYEMYLFHLPLLAVLVLPFFTWFSTITHHQMLISYACLAVYSITLFAVSFAVARWFSDPFNRSIRLYLLKTPMRRKVSSRSATPALACDAPESDPTNPALENR
jgi:peptidoglycan/LPS O-acetylase OafA/YrhL